MEFQHIPSSVWLYRHAQLTHQTLLKPDERLRRGSRKLKGRVVKGCINKS